MSRFARIMAAMIIVVFFTALVTAVANSAPSPAEAEARVGDTVSARYVCKDVEFLKGILRLPDDETITGAANASLASGHCAWSRLPFEVTLLQYMGFVNMKTQSPGRAYIYRVEDPDGDSHYMYMWVEMSPA